MIKPTPRLLEREAFKREQYRLSDERNEEILSGQLCVLCRVGIPGGSTIATHHHEIIAKSQLPGRNGWKRLFSLENIAPACPLHHAQLQHLPHPWFKAMVALGLAQAEQYRVEPFRVYWVDNDYPPTSECIGLFGFGNKYFESSVMPDSLARLYQLNNPGFNPKRFCEFCTISNFCKQSSPENPGVTDSVLIF